MKKLKIHLLLIFSVFYFSCASNAQDETPVLTEDVQQEENPVLYEDLELPEEVEVFDLEEPEEETAKEELETKETVIPEQKEQEEAVQDEEGFFMSDPFETSVHIKPFDEDSALPEEKEKTEEPDSAENENKEVQVNQENTLDEDSGLEESSGKEIIEENNPETDVTETEQTYIEAPEQEEPSESEGESDTEVQEEPEEDLYPDFVKDEAVPSRSTTIKKNQYLDIKYPGTGWVYLGENEGTSLFAYFGRRLNTGGKETLFTLRARKEGKALLSFYKLDRLTGGYIEDWLEGSSAKEEHVEAPSYAEAVPPRPSRKITLAPEEAQENAVVESSKIEIEPYGTEETKAINRRVPPAPAKKEEAKPAAQKETSKSRSTEEDSGVVTVIQNTASQKDNAAKPGEKKEAKQKTENNLPAPAKQEIKEDTSSLTGDSILELAKKAYNDKKYEESLSYLEEFFKKSSARTDEGLFLQAKLYESSSQVRNIKKALDSYETIVNNYPESRHWNESYERMTYLKRFYFSIR